MTLSDLSPPQKAFERHTCASRLAVLMQCGSWFCSLCFNRSQLNPQSDQDFCGRRPFDSQNSNQQMFRLHVAVAKPLSRLGSEIQNLLAIG